MSNPIVRLGRHCVLCVVEWSDYTVEACWMCGEPGTKGTLPQPPSNPERYAGTYTRRDPWMRDPAA